jgi:ribonuclease P protein component
MIARTHRFHGYGSLRGVYQRGQAVRGQLLSLKFVSRGPNRSYRAAVVVSRKVSKSAVVRNRIRRRIYEIVRRHQEQLSPGLDLVFTVFGSELAEMDSTKLELSVVGLLEKTVQMTPPPKLATPHSHGIVNSKGE